MTLNPSSKPATTTSASTQARPLFSPAERALADATDRFLSTLSPEKRGIVTSLVRLLAERTNAADAPPAATRDRLNSPQGAAPTAQLSSAAQGPIDLSLASIARPVGSGDSAQKSPSSTGSQNVRLAPVVVPVGTQVAVAATNALPATQWEKTSDWVLTPTEGDVIWHDNLIRLYEFRGNVFAGGTAGISPPATAIKYLEERNRGAFFRVIFADRPKFMVQIKRIQEDGTLDPNASVIHLRMGNDSAHAFKHLFRAKPKG